MHRHNNLYEQIISFENLVQAATLAQRNKRLKNKTAYFNFKREAELLRLQTDLQNKTYQPGRYRHFTIYEPKKRTISAAPYRDRVLHHALHNILNPIFEPTFIFDSYATRVGKGTHAAIRKFQFFAKRHSYVLKCDVQKYFPSIDREILFGLIKRKIKCADTLWLVKKILDASPVGVDIAQSINQSINRHSYRKPNVAVLCERVFG